MNAALLLSGTERIGVASGIASIWARDAMSTHAAHLTIESWFPDRFVLGLGVSHAPMVAGVRGHVYDKPVAAMQAYLTAADAAPFFAKRPETTPVRVLAALGPKMLALSRDQADGAHPYLVTPEHTAQARPLLGLDRLLLPEQAVVVTDDPAEARAAARGHLAIYLGLPNDRNSWFRLGFTPEDTENGGSDRLLDALVASGDAATCATRLQAHIDAGADHVCVQALAATPEDLLRQLGELAGALSL